MGLIHKIEEKVLHHGEQKQHMYVLSITKAGFSPY